MLGRTRLLQLIAWGPTKDILLLRSALSLWCGMGSHKPEANCIECVHDVLKRDALFPLRAGNHVPRPMVSDQGAPTITTGPKLVVLRIRELVRVVKLYTFDGQAFKLIYSKGIAEHRLRIGSARVQRKELVDRLQ